MAAGAPHRRRPARLRLHDPSGAGPGEDVPGGDRAPGLGEGPSARGGLSRPDRRARRSGEPVPVHHAVGRAVRPGDVGARRRPRRARRRLQREVDLVGHARVVDAARLRLRRRQRARRRLGDVDGGGPAGVERPVHLPAGRVRGAAPAHPARADRRRRRRDGRPRRLHDQRARPQAAHRRERRPLRPAGPHPGQRQRPVPRARGPRAQHVPALRRLARAAGRGRRTEGGPRGDLLRRRHRGDRRRVRAGAAGSWRRGRLRATARCSSSITSRPTT